MFSAIGLSLYSAKAMADQETGATASINVIKKIQARERSVRSAKFSWSEECFEARGVRFDPDSADRPTDDHRASSTIAIPAEDTIFTQTYTLSLEDVKTNYISELRTYDEAGIAHIIKTRRIYDGSNQVSLRDPFVTQNYHYGTIYEENQLNRELTIIYIKPLLQCYRLMYPGIELIKANEFHTDGTELVVNGISCVRCYQDGNRPSIVRIYYLDPLRDYMPIRFMQESGGTVQIEIDFDYLKDAQHGWVLSGWETVRFAADGKATHRFNAKVENYLINPEFEPKEFTIEFPPGTLIDDLRERAAFVQKADGARRRVSELSNSYQEALNSNPESLDDSTERSTLNKWWLIILNGIVFLSVIVYFGVKKLTR